MDKDKLSFYSEFSMYTNPGLYKPLLKKLPLNIKKIGDLVRGNIIHRSTLADGNTGTNVDKKFGDMTQVPWYRQPEDDILVTASAMLAELYRRDKRGFVKTRKEKDKLVLTCRFVSILVASILKSKGIPCRVRAGHADYFDMGVLGKVSTDHWLNQYWDFKQERWITIDVDGSWSLNDKFDPYDMPLGTFDFPANAWLQIRNGKDDPNRFYNASSHKGLMVVFWSLFYDFHCLMNNEIIYSYGPHNLYGSFEKFSNLSGSELKEIDILAQLMKTPDENFIHLQKFWNTNNEFRLLAGGLL
ncbi:MAG: hypothetical protein WC254_03375 [Candidatus Woesearchaeota archaeon]|jgi:hypothetical protein